MTIKEIESLEAYVREVADDMVGSVHGKLSLFRGQRDATWLVRPSIVRGPTFDPGRSLAKDPNDPNDNSAERRLLIVFGDEAVPLLPEWVWTGSAAEVGWKKVLIAQHYRVPTRLLDWSTNPLVALYFAVAGKAETCTDKCKTAHPSWYPDHVGEHYSAVYVLRGRDSFSVFSLAKTSPTPPIYKGAHEPGVIRPPAFDRRIVAQSSLFTISASPADPINPDLLLLIAAKNCQAILHQLDVCNISQKTLYPDLEHLGEYLSSSVSCWEPNPCK